MKPTQKYVVFANGSNSNNDNSQLMEKSKALTIKMDSRFQSLKEEMPEMRMNYNNRSGDHGSKNDDTPMCKCHEVNYIQSGELNNNVRNDLEHFKRCIRSMRTVYYKLFGRYGQSKTDLEKSITKFLDGQRVASMYIKNNVNDMIIKMKQNEKNCQTTFKNLERKIDEWSKSQNVFSDQMDKTDPPPPQAHTEHVNAIFIDSGKSDESSKTQKDSPPPIIINNKIPKDKPSKASKKGYHVVETKEYPFPLCYNPNKSPLLIIIPGAYAMSVQFCFLYKPMKKKGSSNTSNVDLSPVSHSKLNKDVKQYSRKDLLSCNNSHLGETSSAYVCNDAMNVSCNSMMFDLFDDNNFFIFDDESVRFSPVSKMPFREKPRDSIN
nr:hypothetical protein [Tanacetum cinerariifolium]